MGFGFSLWDLGWDYGFAFEPREDCWADDQLNCAFARLSAGISLDPR